MRPLITKTFPVWDSDRPVLDMLAEGRKLQRTYIHENGKTSMIVSGTEKKLQHFEQDLEVNELIRVSGILENLTGSIQEFAKRMGKVSNTVSEDWNAVTIERNANKLVITIGYLEGEESADVSCIPDNNGVLGEVPCAEEDGVLLDTQGFDKGEDGYLPGEDTGRPGDSGAGTGKTVVDVPLDEDEWLTVKEYSEKHEVPLSTVRFWISKGWLKCDTATYPRRVLDEKEPPVRNEKGPGKLRREAESDILEDANSLVD